MPREENRMNLSERLELAEATRLTEGTHLDPGHGLCVVEMRNLMAGLSHSDRMESEVLGRFLRTWNDSLPSDEERERRAVVLKAERALDVAGVRDRRRRPSFNGMQL